MSEYQFENFSYKLIWKVIKCYSIKKYSFFKKYNILAVTLYFIKFTSLVIIKIFKAIPFEKKWNIFYS